MKQKFHGENDKRTTVKWRKQEEERERVKKTPPENCVDWLLQQLATEEGTAKEKTELIFFRVQLKMIYGINCSFAPLKFNVCNQFVCSFRFSTNKFLLLFFLFILSLLLNLVAIDTVAAAVVQRLFVSLSRSCTLTVPKTFSDG